MSILDLNHVSIRYMTGDFKDVGLKEFFLKKVQGKYEVKEFWAVDDVTFSLDKGEMLGIIGTNGAGKSTLLKAITGIMTPTRGRIRRRGSVAALLELASGFDPDLTVRENTYLRGAILGYTREFMEEAYDQIIDFSELKEFEHRPFKQLSSGMKSRLGFAIAALVRPDILILDEVLSVGDGAFRKKSEEKMREIIKDGTTTLFVSHSLDQVKNLCSKVLWLDHGRMIAYGDTESICDAYFDFLMAPPEIRRIPENSMELGRPKQVPEESKEEKNVGNADNMENKENMENPENGKDASAAEHASGDGVLEIIEPEGGDAVTGTSGEQEKKVGNRFIPVSGVIISQKTLSLQPGESCRITAWVQPPEAAERLVEWQSQDPSVVSVDSEGTITALQYGNANVVVKTKEGSFSATCRVSVPVLCESVTLNEENLSLDRGGAAQLKASLSPDNITNPKVTWESDKPEVCTVTETGLLLTGANGNAVITARCGGCMASCHVTVGIPLKKIELAAGEPAMYRGEKRQIGVKLVPSNTTEKEIIFESTDAGILRVANDGTVTALNEGKAAITVSSKSGDVRETAEFTVSMPLQKITSVVNLPGGVLVRIMPFDGSGSSLYRKAGDGEWEKLWDAAGPAWLDSKVSYGERYTYKLIPDKSPESGAGGEEEPQAEEFSIFRIEAPKLHETVFLRSGVTLSWDAVPGASCYRIMRCIGEDGK